MRYSLEELREYRDLLEQIEVLEGGDRPCKVCEKRERNFQQSLEDQKGGQFWTEERRKAQSERMKGNQRWKGVPLGPKTKEETELDIALAPRPEGSTVTPLPREYHCSICNAPGHNARTCTYFDGPSTPPSEGI